MNNTSFFVDIWVALRCNFRCRYFYMKGKYDNADLDCNVVANVIEFIKKNIKKLSVNF